MKGSPPPANAESAAVARWEDDGGHRLPILKEPSMAYQSLNPFDGKILHTFDELDDAALEQALATADQCFASWRRTSFAERAGVLARALCPGHPGVRQQEAHPRGWPPRPGLIDWPREPGPKSTP